MLAKIILHYIFSYLVTYASGTEILVYGPGLQPQKIFFPARYFFINFTSVTADSYTPKLADNLGIEVNGNNNRKSSYCRAWVNKLDRKDGTFIIRYKLYETCYDLSINIFYKSKHIEGSPFKFAGPVYSEQCNCPENELQKWLIDNGCPSTYDQIENDLSHFNKVNMKEQVQEILSNYHKPESSSFCHYVLKNNEIFRNCYGKHVGFNMFSDNILLFLSRKVHLPDMELVINLGDWPLIFKKNKPLAIFSWCGSDETLDIVMPTYDITEATLENMGRVTLDILSVQGSIDHDWAEREPRAFWRGRDSRAERLKLVDIARANPELYNVSLTNFFFFRDKESQYGPKQPHISFFKFFDYKYIINVDGTVAAYRMPYLLAGGGLVLKQESPFYEHFYKQLKPWHHYVPVARDLSDLTERVLWARDHDEEARKIAENARIFANKNLLPQHILCYHAVLFSEWSKRIENEVTIQEGMTHVPQPEFSCDCEIERKKEIHEEL